MNGREDEYVDRDSMLYRAIAGDPGESGQDLGIYGGQPMTLTRSLLTAGALVLGGLSSLVLFGSDGAPRALIYIGAAAPFVVISLALVPRAFRNNRMQHRMSLRDMSPAIADPAAPHGSDTQLPPPERPPWRIALTVVSVLTYVALYVTFLVTTRFQHHHEASPDANLVTPAPAPTLSASTPLAHTPPEATPRAIPSTRAAPTPTLTGVLVVVDASSPVPCLAVANGGYDTVINPAPSADFSSHIATLNGAVENTKSGIAEGRDGATDPIVEHTGTRITLSGRLQAVTPAANCGTNAAFVYLSIHHT